MPTNTNQQRKWWIAVACALLLLAAWMVWRIPAGLETASGPRKKTAEGLRAPAVSPAKMSAAANILVTNRAAAANPAVVAKGKMIGEPRDENHVIRLVTHVIDTSEKTEAGTPARDWIDRAATLPAARSTAWIVQFGGPVHEEDKKQLADAGAVLCGYVPNNAFAVKMDVAALRRVAALPFVQWIGPYKAEYKIQPALAAKREGKVLVDVSTFTPNEVEPVAKELAARGATKIDPVRNSNFGRVRAEIPAAAIPEISTLESVQWIEEYVPPKLFNNRAVEGPRLNVTNVWTARGLTGTGQVVAVADTGLDTGDITNLHTDFMGRVKAAIALGRANNWSDPYGHGTHVCGSVLGDGTASGGKYRGVASGAQLVMQSVLDSGGGLGGLPANLGDLFLQALTNGAHIHSDSWGSPAYGFYTSEARDVDEFMWNHPDMLVCIAAGNDGYDNDGNGVINPGTMDSPGTAKNSLTVGASENFHNAGEASDYHYIDFGYFMNPIVFDLLSQPYDGVHQGMAAFSSRGPCLDGRVKPDIVAPGTDIISTHSSIAGYSWGPAPDNSNYMIDGGTSMATPLSAGCATLFRQYFTDRAGVTNPSAALIKAALVNGARSLTPGQYGTGSYREIPPLPRPNSVEGWGQIDAEDTLFPPAPNSLAFFDGNSLVTGATNVYTVNVGGTNAFRVTLCWSDFPGTPGSSQNLVNDLDLVVIGPDGVTNFASGMSAPDRTNNIEGIDLAAAARGLYRIEVRGFNVPSGPQPYAVVLSGPVAPVIVHTPLASTFDTVNPYAVTATITSAVAIDTNQLFVMWNTDGSTNFNASAVALLSNSLYRGFIPAQPQNTVVHYYITAATNGLVAVSPAGAPAMLYQFSVTAAVSLEVRGTPVRAGAVWPPYGVTIFASGNTVIATAPAFAWTENFAGYTCTGWTGSGSVPIIGNSNSVSFQSLENSRLTWQWRFDSYGLVQSSSPPGLVSTTTWWAANSIAHTITAPPAGIVSGVMYRFTGWYLDGARLPDSINVADNPGGKFSMGRSHNAVAKYLPATQDGDGNGMADWWEMLYFGGIGNSLSGDMDRDGFNNQAEFADQTNPRDARSFPVPPVIAHVPLANPQPRPAPFNVDAVITDNLAVASATLHWQRNGGTWQSAAMASNANDHFTATIPAPGTCGDQFSYFITASDPGANTSTNGPFAFLVAYPVMIVTPPDLGTNLVESGTTGIVSIVVSNAGNGQLSWTARVVRVDLTDDMESGTNKWTHNGSLDLWHITTYRAHSGTHSWYQGDDSTHLYPDASDDRLYTPTLHPGSNAVLNFWHWIWSELDHGVYAWDGAVVEISTNAGASFDYLTPVGGYPYMITPNPESAFAPDYPPCFAGTGGWQQASFDLSAFANQDIILMFRFGADYYTHYEGWYLDDITITSDAFAADWLAVQPPTGSVSGVSASNAPCALNAAIATNGGLYRALVRIEGNDPVAPTNIVSVTMRVDSRPRAAINFARQWPLNGSGSVTISNSIFDADGDPVSLRVEFSANGGATWTNLFVTSATAATGGVSINNAATQQLGGIVTAPSNALAILWPTTNAPAIAFSSNVLVRVTPSDVWFAGRAVTSAPFAVDNVAPSATGAVVIAATSAFGNYFAGNVITSSWSGFTDIGLGVAGYFLSTTNGGGTTNGTFAPSSPAPLGGLQLNATNNVFVWPRDAAGNIGPAASASVFVLDPAGDADGDGFSNAAEEIAGTSSTDSNSILRITGASADPILSRYVIRWPYVSNRIYSLQMSSNAGDPPFLVLTNPPVIVTNFTAVFDLTNAPPAPLLQFRLGVQPAP